MGTRLKDCLSTAADEDHPHACGDKGKSFLNRNTAKGSSPRVWGQDSILKVSDVDSGIIPTRVGTSFFSFRFLALRKDHPHACGDKVALNFHHLLF